MTIATAIDQLVNRHSDDCIAAANRIAENPTPAENAALAAYTAWQLATDANASIGLTRATYRTCGLAMTAAAGPDGNEAAIWLAAAGRWCAGYR